MSWGENRQKRPGTGFIIGCVGARRTSDRNRYRRRRPNGRLRAIGIKRVKVIRRPGPIYSLDTHRSLRTKSVYKDTEAQRELVNKTGEILVANRPVCLKPQCSPTQLNRSSTHNA